LFFLVYGESNLNTFDSTLIIYDGVTTDPKNRDSMGRSSFAGKIVSTYIAINLRDMFLVLRTVDRAASPFPAIQ
jgi:hypothetical protein